MKRKSDNKQKHGKMVNVISELKLGSLPFLDFFKDIQPCIYNENVVFRKLMMMRTE